MPLAQFREDRPYEQAPKEVEVDGKGLARVYGYMGIALLITMGVSLFTSWLFSSHVNSAASLEVMDNWIIGYFGMIIGCAIGCLILGIYMPLRMVRGKHSLWVPFILYSVFMGGLLSIVLVAGISWAIIGEAFGISAAAFLIMFFIGYFAKKDFTLGAYIGIGILSMGLLLVVFWLIFGILTNSLNNMGAYALDMVYSGLVCLIMLIFIAIDGYRVKKIAASGSATNNMYLYCAYIMYSDFITLLVRVIIILARSLRN